MASKKGRGSAGEDAKTILNRVRQLVRALRLFDREATTKFGVGAAQMFVLHVLNDQTELSLNELADRTATDQSSVSIVVTKLVRMGLVRRERSTEDRRELVLSLTAKGRALVRRAPPAAQRRMMESVAGMKPAEREQLVALLGKLLSGMGVTDTEPGMLFTESPRKRRAAPRARRG
jgi:DNA-binding MarR family transcriptional regulator